ncbi:hypothetical protein, partial [Xanthomonas citri]|uniref:hypothetical protein n=1 Tax=Xanthomonas citri TaxID=346 RepID=UPI00058B35B6
AHFWLCFTRIPADPQVETLQAQAGELMRALAARQQPAEGEEAAAPASKTMAKTPKARKPD